MKDRFNNAPGPQVRLPKKRRNLTIPLLAVCVLVAGLQSATQFFAHAFKYQPALGDHLHQVYLPWRIVSWSQRWYPSYQDDFLRAGSIGACVAGVGLIALVVVKMLLANTSKANEYLHGSARWAIRRIYGE